MSAENISFGLGIPGDRGKKIPTPPVSRKQVLAKVERMKLDEVVKRELLRKLSRYPSDAVGKMLPRLGLMAEEIRKQIQNGEL